MKEKYIPDQQIFKDLELRIGPDHLSLRLKKQVSHSVMNSTGGFKFYWENVNFMPKVLKLFLKLFFLKNRAVRNTHDYRVEKVDVILKNLPKAFHKLRILQLSDLHIGASNENLNKICGIIQSLQYDVCFITGDFRLDTFGDYGVTIDGVRKIVDSVQCEYGIFSILGNHDFIEMVPGIEELGIKMLLNEAVSIKRGSDNLWIVGVDDPHYYEADNLSMALEKVDKTNTRILLAHSPEILHSASRSGISYYLCGHTHGGQICLPGGVPLITNTRIGRRYVSGAWKYEDMNGYTSRGAGSSCFQARFFCTPELTLHCLHSCK